MEPHPESSTPKKRKEAGGDGPSISSELESNDPATSSSSELPPAHTPVRSDSTIARALEASAWTVRLLRNDQLVGFVRVTSDQALNANLWDLRVVPDEPQAKRLLAVLVHAALSRLRKELPGCSISLASPPQAIEVLETFDFITDPNGIRAMGLDL